MEDNRQDASLHNSSSGNTEDDAKEREHQQGRTPDIEREKEVKQQREIEEGKLKALEEQESVSALLALSSDAQDQAQEQAPPIAAPIREQEQDQEQPEEKNVLNLLPLKGLDEVTEELLKEGLSATEQCKGDDLHPDPVGTKPVQAKNIDHS